MLVPIFTECQPKDEARATMLVRDAHVLVDNGQWNSAQLLLDSVHRTYPKQVQQRRMAKALQDSITYLQAQQTLTYSDSLLQTLLPKVDALLKDFRYEKNEQYEDHGRYVHRLLSTGSNTSRNFLQAYVSDDRVTTVKSYYYGATRVDQSAITLAANTETARFSGANHTFEAGGWHDIMTIDDAPALELLNFVNTHTADRIRVHGEGKNGTSAWTYYLTDKEKTSLSRTYELGFLMKDIRLLEQHINLSTAQIERYEKNHSTQKD